MSIKKRVATNTVVNIGALGLNALVQVAQVAILSSVWSLEQYGTWILLSTIPVYFALSDLGFAAAAQSDMTMAFGRGELAGTRTTYHSTWALTVLLCAATLATAGLLLLLARGHEASSWSLVAVAAERGWTIFLFIAYAGISLCSRVVLAGFRAMNHYAFGTIVYELSIFLENATMLGIALAHGSFDACVGAGILSRLIWTVVADALLARRTSGMALGIKAVRIAELRRLLKPALAAMATPASFAFSMQGIVGVIGYTISPAAVALFNPVRTLSRVALQFVGTFNRAAMPEVSRAASVANHAGLKRLIVATVASSVFVLLPCAVLFAIFGRTAIEIWTQGRVSPPWIVVALLGLDMFIHGTWFYLYNLLLSTNEHTRIAPVTLGVSILSVCAAIPAGAHAGLGGVAAVVVSGDLATLLAVSFLFRESAMFRAAFGTTASA